MSNRAVDIVRTALRGANARNLPKLETEQDLHRWMDERKRFRDINETELERVDREYESVAALEEQSMRRFRTTEPGSKMRQFCLERVDDARKKAAGMDQVRAIRRMNIELNNRFIVEIEKAVAVGDVGIEIEEMDAMSRQFEKNIRDWWGKVDGSASGAQPAIEKNTGHLDELERELVKSLAPAPPDIARESAAPTGPAPATGV